MTLKERNRLLFQYVTPTILSQVSVFLFSIVDGVFVGRGIGGNALGAVNIAFPYIMVFTALTMLATVGGLTVAAIRIGRGDLDGASQVFMHSVVMSSSISLLMMLPAVLAPEAVVKLCGAGEGFVEPAAEYLFWYGVFFVPCGLCSSLLGFCRVDGDPLRVTVSVVTCTACNVVLDYLLIFPAGMGLAGAAIATGASQTLNMLLGLTHYFSKKGTIRFRRVKTDAALARRILIRGIPECVSQFSAPICIALTNIMLAAMLGDDAVNAYSVLGYAASFSVAVFIGTAEGIQPLFGNCYGAKNEKDLKAFLRAGLIVATAGSFVISAVIWLLGDGICSLYRVSGSVRAVTLGALPAYVLGFVVQAPTIVITAYLYSTTRTHQALTINAVRSFVVNTAVILLVPRLFGPRSIWYTFIIYEALALLLAVTVLKRADRHGAVSGAAE